MTRPLARSLQEAVERAQQHVDLHSRLNAVLVDDLERRNVSLREHLTGEPDVRPRVDE
jgi:hypothetical protein